MTTSLVLSLLAAVCFAPPVEDRFAAAGVRGAFVLEELDGPGRVTLHQQEADRPHLPASTFKIPNSLIGLATGVISGRDFALKWDGVERRIAAWNRDHDLASAMKFSVVWYYQEVARRVGLERMRHWVGALEYGDRKVGRKVDSFWLDGTLRITARQQVDFLRRFHRGELPVDAAHVALVHDLIILDDQPGAVLRGKTGLGHEKGGVVGWLVGCVHRGDKVWLYATLVLAPGGTEDKVMPLRRELSEALLRDHGALP